MYRRVTINYCNILNYRSLASGIYNKIKMTELMEIDGSVLEGGGQILRIAIAFSAILSKPVRVINIRANRKKPGLAAQHLKGIQLVAEMCQATLKGDTIGSSEIEFWPSKINGGHYRADPKTAGSISLLLQISLPVALLADNHVTLELLGGTNAEMAPQIDYTTEVFRTYLKKFGARFDFMLHKRGYYPRGGGHVTVDVNPIRQLKPRNVLLRGEVEDIVGWSYVSGSLPVKIAYEMAEGIRQDLKSFTRKINIQCYKEDFVYTRESASGIVVMARTTGACMLGADAIGRADVEPIETGRRAAAQLARTMRSGACVDVHMQDQLIIYMALAVGKSSIRVDEVTLHTKTAIHVTELMTEVKFTISPDGDQQIIECRGMGIVNKNRKA